MFLNQFTDITASRSESFARFTLEKRFPDIIDKIIANNSFDRSINSRLELFKKEQYVKEFPIVDGHTSWETFFDRYGNQHWHTTPFFVLEVYIYNKILWLTDYYINKIDPFLWIKSSDLQNNLSLFDRFLSTYSSYTTPEIITFSLQGNIADLSQLVRSEGANHTTISNDIEKCISHFEKHDLYQVDIILDNSGVELFGDLILAHHIIEKKLAQRVVLHFKKVPFIVSDATLQDLSMLLNALKRFPSLHKAINRHMEDGHIILKDELFWTSPTHFFTEGFSAIMEPSDMIISKGDANYRRFFGDKEVPVTERLDSLLGYLTTPTLLLRVCKSEIISNIPKEVILRLDYEDPKWKSNGKYGVIQFYNPPFG